MLDKNTHLFDKQVENPISVEDILQVTTMQEALLWRLKEMSL